MPRPHVQPGGLFLALVCGYTASANGSRFVDATAALGLDGLAAGRCKFADLNGDGRPDVVANVGLDVPPVVFLNAYPSPFRRLDDTGLPALARGDLIVFADIDNDGHADAIVTRYVEDADTRLERTAVHPGAGDGTFGPAQKIDTAPPATTCAIAIGDANADGRLDLYFGNWYRAYGESLDGYPNDLLLQSEAAEAISFARAEFAYEENVDDAEGRPTYGAIFLDTRHAQVLPRWSGITDLNTQAYWAQGGVALLELNYGRRWNRLWRRDSGASDWRVDPATHHGLDGDAIRHGRYPDWLTERAKMDPRFDRPDEEPFRANGNTFDVAVGDIDRDGDLDLFLAEITHAWAGDASDRSRFLVNALNQKGGLTFSSPEKLRVDRLPQRPEDGDLQRWNQGDIFTALADFDHDGRLDLLLCSSDYPDSPPHDERLRIFIQQPDGSFEDRTSILGIDHIGAGQPSLGDVDGDGDLDILVGQSFNRMTPELRRQAGVTNGSITADADRDAKPKPRLRLFLNEATNTRASVVLRLSGNGTTVARDALGALVRCTADLDAQPETRAVTQTRSLTGIGGHAGKQDEFLLHFGVGAAHSPVTVEILWPGRSATPITTLHVDPGARVEVTSP